MTRGRPATPVGTFGEIGTTRLDSGKWLANVTVRLPSGKGKRIRRTGKSEAEAKRRVKAAAVDATGTEDTDLLKGSSTVNQLIDVWLNQYDGAASSITQYRSTARVHIAPAVGSLRLVEVTTPKLERFFLSLTRSRWQASRTLLMNACKYAVRMGVMDHNPAAETTPAPASDFKARALTPVELVTFRRMVRHYAEQAKSFGVQLPELVEVLAGTGARISDVCVLRWSDVAGNRVTITDVKGGGRKRTVTIPPTTVAALERQRKVTFGWSPYVFTHGSAEQVRRQQPQQWLRWARIVWADREPVFGPVEPDVSWVTFHVFRRSMATWLAGEVSIETATLQLGHLQAATTEGHYIDRTGMVPDATEVLGKILGSGTEMAE
ncbi:MAG: site-specific integrase [Corynebacterium variabile]|uniref:site-specific integrase n=1 Tax=Corynebacterium variabile TaxID=1727 RepID=UPI0026490D68|nr:site-specific integrase [Corynebacterium variabile]MDN6662845.1 site-specific integrase [Corynebacterium variabile]